MVSEEPPSRPHLILLTVDTLRADHMSLYGYPRTTTPNLDALAQKAVVFDRAIAQWPKTGTSVASMFIGRYPQSTGLTHRAALEIPAGFGTLPTALQESGYNTLAVISNPVLSADLGWDRGFDEYVPSWGEEMSDDPVIFRQQLSAQRVNQLAKELLERHGYGSRDEGTSLAERASKKPLFLWLHYSDPHAPYYTPEGFENPFLSDSMYTEGSAESVNLTKTHGRAVPGLEQLRDYVAQYDANVLITDQHIGAMLQHLGSLGLLRNALTVVTADHGESLGEHGLNFEHGPLPYNASAHVPLLVVPPPANLLNPTPVNGGPGVRGLRVKDPVELIDLAPTLVEILLRGRRLEHGFRSDPGAQQAASKRNESEVSDGAATSTQPTRAPFDQAFEGTSLVPYFMDSALQPKNPVAFSEAGSAGRRRYRSLQEKRFKLIYRQPGQPRRPEPRDFELYDLLVDPLETTNLLDRHPEVVRRMRRTLLDFAERAVPSLTENRRPKSRQERRALKNLGYLQ